jgi:hypothetical protein
VASLYWDNVTEQLSVLKYGQLDVLPLAALYLHVIAFSRRTDIKQLQEYLILFVLVS